MIAKMVLRDGPVVEVAAKETIIEDPDLDEYARYCIALYRNEIFTYKRLNLH